ncbi:nuclear speckle splicing regulatory protein 1 isoform X2 [Syngnathus scovelli]|uniref:nuclear speckle splicing regulatory protein 1 isoform X2 n=1 Tax=Syngnathus scovelli TaxID=161590 RepID=UPI0021107824|nr:nuclear speckle splicing regulatory protein 1 isoform X2 [Syngnathus scovelli]
MCRICRSVELEHTKMAVPGKQYGLILPQKKCLKPTRLQKLCVFGDDSDDETSVGESLQKEADKKKTMRQTQLEMKKALEEDSTVYDYDAVYDDIQKQRLETSKKVLSGPAKKPKYIHQLMKAVDSRKKEQERRDERKIQKEREAEGNQFADKDAYVTTAYKRKLQEQKEEEERAKHEAAIEAALDVRKQNDLSGFYRHLLNQTVGEEAIPDRLANNLKSEDGGIPETSQTSHEITSDGEAQEEKHSKTSSSHSKRHYRRRSPASGSDDEREREARRKKEPKKDEKHSERRDRDKDGQSHRRRDEPREKGDRRKSDEEKGREEEVRGKGKGEAAGEEKDEGEKEDGEKEGQTEETKVNKFAKRSNEQTLSSARDRYLARQMARSTSKSYIEREED